MSRLTQAIHLCFGLPSFSSPRWYHLQSLTSWSRLFTWPNHLSLAFLHLSVMFSTFSLSLMSSFFTWFLSVWPHAHLHIFISATSSFFTWELYSDWHCLHSVQHSWLDDHFVYLSSNMWWYLSCICRWVCHGVRVLMGGGIVLGALRAWLL